MCVVYLYINYSNLRWETVTWIKPETKNTAAGGVVAVVTAGTEVQVVLAAIAGAVEWHVC